MMIAHAAFAAVLRSLRLNTSITVRIQNRMNSVTAATIRMRQSTVRPYRIGPPRRG
jgi:hypothetical protein